ncbi:YgiQ family radical SAM protein [Candidatus Xianfuyuplasma coldseepsis]|uniref:YgiQ family radical SAM protein n=1 Tax=Candidatus Xianfuyuplasma coldseepsis TaxID=2782163 RepID=A0A7L7KS27_9MOLU|nr:YgiQ family radical SAM protein [Xianfuyuplasma coldseepsis]QMS85621.1 YgiQ family radical SAM protein [Xianfuyuplasma coldseepsis]
MFLPVSKQDLIDREIQQLDFVFVSGDAYIDHPSFGAAIISRWLERHGYTVGMIPQPQTDEDYSQLGTPRLGFLVSSGNIDSMVNHYSVSKRRRKKDSYSPGGKMGLRPDYATIVYGQTLRKLFPHTPIIIGGIEASLRRFAHYDYWSDSVRKSILIDSKADLLLYGMSEKSIIEVADSLDSGLAIRDIIFVRGTVYKTSKESYLPQKRVNLPSYDAILSDKKEYAKSFAIKYQHIDSISARPLMEAYRYHYIVQNPPHEPLTQSEMDQVYDLPFERDVHPMHEAVGHVPAIDEVKFSIISNRGCYGGCSFCALTYHQGRVIQSRSKESIVNEAKIITADKDFKGYIHDIGGPTANFYDIACTKQTTHGVCLNKQCLSDKPCSQLEVSHKNYLDILREVRQLNHVKKVFVRSGIRYDYVLYDNDESFFKELVQHHVSGQLKVAPEHVSDRVLDVMNKPQRDLYDRFVKRFYELNKRYNKEQYLVPYLMSSHPGSTLHDAIELACYVRDLGYNPEQVQDFYPTPGTLSTAMYYTGLDPRTMEPIYVPKTKHEKAMQRALIQYRNPKNYYLVKEALETANRTDLIGYDARCLIVPNRK